MSKIISTPYWKEFKVFDGAQFTVKGSSLNDEPYRFSINLSSQTEVEPTTSLQVEVNFDRKKVLLNSIKDSIPGVEQPQDNPFLRGGPFDVNVQCTADSFVIKFGGTKAEFKYRGKPKAEVKYIYIEGQATISALDVQ